VFLNSPERQRHGSEETKRRDGFCARNNAHHETEDVGQRGDGHRGSSFDQRRRQSPGHLVAQRRLAAPGGQQQKVVVDAHAQNYERTVADHKVVRPAHKEHQAETADL